MPEEVAAVAVPDILGLGGVDAAAGAGLLGAAEGAAGAVGLGAADVAGGALGADVAAAGLGSDAAAAGAGVLGADVGAAGAVGTGAEAGLTAEQIAANAGEQAGLAGQAAAGGGVAGPASAAAGAGAGVTALESGLGAAGPVVAPSAAGEVVAGPASAAAAAFGGGGAGSEGVTALESALGAPGPVTESTSAGEVVAGPASAGADTATFSSPPTPSTPGSKDQSSVSQKIIDAALKYGPLGLAAANLVGNRGASKRYSSEISNIGAPQRAAGQEMISQAQAGEINPADKYAIDQWEKGAITQIRAYYAKAGISDSSMATLAEQDVHARATAMREEARQQLLQLGINTLNTVDKYQAAAINAEMQGDQATAQQATNFLNAYGQWLRALPTLTGTGATPPQPGH